MTTHAERPVRWGVVGTGGIAAAFIQDLRLLDEAVVVAVGSRDASTARALATRLGVSRHHGSYAELVADPEVDAVYVATPHPFHHPCTVAAIDAGKAVLVEKPFTMDAAQAEDLVDRARSQGVFLMEAMWTRFLPHVVRVRELVRSGRLGDIRSLTADLGGFAPPDDPDHRIFRPELGGGALLDIGVYLVSFASMLFGAPVRTTAVSHLTTRGVDAQTAVVLEHSHGQQAVLFASIEATTGCRATISGTRARLEIDGPFFRPAAMRLVDREGQVTVFEDEHEGLGLRHQVVEVGRCLHRSLLESPVMRLDESVSVMRTLDEVRRQVGLSYPGEPGHGPA